MINYKFLLGLSVAILLCTGLSAQCDRATIIANYNNVFVPSAVSATELGWTGSTSTCTPGTISQLAQTRTLARIDYYRQLCGLPGNITLDASLNAKCQEAALMMSANGMLSHSPTSSWLCYTADGASAAGSSNLSLGSFASGAIFSFMNDAGTGNTAVGHRRWILYSKATKFGHGATTSADALWVTGNTGPAPTVNFVAFPSEGFFPAPLLPWSERWSFSKPGADFSSATVEMKGPGGVTVPVTLEPLNGSYGDMTIVWKPSGILGNGPTDVAYSVKVANVKVNNVPQDFNYTVIISQPVHPPVCPAGKAWSESQCDCVFPADVRDITSVGKVSAMNPFYDKFRITVEHTTLPAVQVAVYDMTGREIHQRPHITETAGTVELQWESSGWAEGMYFVTIHTGSGKIPQVIKAIKQ